MDRARERMATQGGVQRDAQDAGWSMAPKNSVSLGIVGALAFVITAIGFRSGSVWWLLAAVGQFFLVGARVGVFSAEAGRQRGASVLLCGVEFHRVSCRIVLELYLALLLTLPFLTVFDEGSWDRLLR